jgi:hypothetical protein
MIPHKDFVPIGVIRTPEGKEVPVYIGKEYSRLMLDVVKKLNDLETRVTALE